MGRSPLEVENAFLMRRFSSVLTSSLKRAWHFDPSGSTGQRRDRKWPVSAQTQKHREQYTIMPFCKIVVSDQMMKECFWFSRVPCMGETMSLGGTIHTVRGVRHIVPPGPLDGPLVPPPSGPLPEPVVVCALLVVAPLKRFRRGA